MKGLTAKLFILVVFLVLFSIGTFSFAQLIPTRTFPGFYTSYYGPAVNLVSPPENTERSLDFEITTSLSTGRVGSIILPGQGYNYAIRVKSNGVITREWEIRTIPHNTFAYTNDKFTVTVGPGKDCRDKGDRTCEVDIFFGAEPQVSNGVLTASSYPVQETPIPGKELPMYSQAGGIIEKHYYSISVEGGPALGATGTTCNKAMTKEGIYLLDPEDCVVKSTDATFDTLQQQSLVCDPNKDPFVCAAKRGQYKWKVMSIGAGADTTISVRAQGDAYRIACLKDGTQGANADAGNQYYCLNDACYECNDGQSDYMTMRNPVSVILGPSQNLQTHNFDLTIKDSSPLTFVKCYYKVINNGTEGDWKERLCSPSGASVDIPIKIGPGPENDCRVQGTNTCNIVVRAVSRDDKREYDGYFLEGRSNRTYSILFAKPISTILDPEQSSLQKENFRVTAKDVGNNSNVDICEYKVTSAGILTRDWTARPCNRPFTVTVATISNQDVAVCRDEGEDACRVYVRSKDEYGTYSNEDSRLFTIDWTKPDSVLDRVDPAVAYHRDDFKVYIRDIDKSGTGLSECRYRLYNGDALVMDSIRVCNDAINISVPEQCSAQGHGACKIDIWATDRATPANTNAPGRHYEFNIDTGSSISSIFCDVRQKCEIGETQMLNLENPLGGLAERYSNKNYDYKVCCGGFGLVGNTCSGNNAKFLRLNAATSAKAEIYGVNSVNYSTNVCISSRDYVVECTTSTLDVNDGACLVSLSDNTNANVARCDVYETKVRCRTLQAPSVIFNSPVDKSLQTANFMLNATVIDNTGRGLSSCLYKIDAGGTEIKPYTVFACQNNTAFIIPISVGPSADCRVQGNESCTVSVQVTDRARGFYISSISFNVSFPGPTTRIKSPEETEEQIESFNVDVEDVDNANKGLTCQYKVQTENMTTSDWRQRNCNSSIPITIRPGGDCTRQSNCTVFVKTTDGNGNEANHQRLFNVKFGSPNSTIVTPWNIFYQNFTLQIDDIDKSGYDLDKCQYKVISGGSITQDWTNRNCRRPLQIGVGAQEICRTVGNESCIVSVRSNDTFGNRGVETEKKFGIDFTPPAISITGPSSDVWIGTNFNVIVDDESNSVIGIDRCEYKVINKGVEKIGFTARQCDQPLLITVGVNGLCSLEGGSSCTVVVRDVAKSGLIGQHNRTFNVDYSNSISTTLSFSNIRAASTTNSVNFSADLPFVLQPLFRVCNANSSISECRNAFSLEGQNCNGNNCLCGVLVPSSRPNCEYSCFDKTDRYYLLLTGATSDGSSPTTVVSDILSYTCPQVDITRLNSILNYFETKSTNLLVVKMQDDYILRTVTLTDEERARKLDEIVRIDEARLVANNYTSMIRSYLPVITRPKADEIFALEIPTNDTINRILNTVGINVPSMSSFVLSNNNISLNNAFTLSINVSTQGGQRYGTVDCGLTKTRLLSGQGCMAINTGINTTFVLVYNATSVGEGSVSYCRLNVSLNSECAGSTTYQSLNNIASFNVTGEGGTAVVAPNATFSFLNSTVLINNNVSIVISVTNPSTSFYSNSVCTITKPDNSLVNVNSACSQINENSNPIYNVQYNVTTLNGTWSATCAAYKSANADCSNGQLLNNRSVGTFTVTNDTNAVYGNVNASISLLRNASLPNDNITARAIFSNPQPNPVYANMVCSFTQPSGAISTVNSQCLQVQTTQIVYSSLNVTNTLGTWSYLCNAYKSSQPDCSTSSIINSSSGNFVVSSDPDFVYGNNIAQHSLSRQIILVNTTISARINVTNPKPYSTFFYSNCTFTRPDNNVETNRTSCSPIISNSMYTSSINATNNTGSWNVACVTYNSTASDCSNPTVLLNNSLGSVLVTNDSEIAYPTNASMRLISNNVALNDNVVLRTIFDNQKLSPVYLQTRCSFTQPSSSVLQLQTSCTQVATTQTADITQNVTTNTGTWSYSCIAYRSSQADCSSITPVNSSSGTFTVNALNQNATFSYVQSTITPNSNVNVTVSVTNPSSAFYSNSVCAFTKPDNSLVSVNSACSVIGANSNPTYSVLYNVTTMQGTWSATCAAYKSANADCSNGQLLNNRSVGTFTVSTPVGPAVAVANATYTIENTNVLINTSASVRVNVSNPTDNVIYATSSCTFSMPNGTQISNQSTPYCIQVNTSGNSIQYSKQNVSNVTGTWNVLSCFTYKWPASDCSGTPELISNKTVGSFTVSNGTSSNNIINFASAIEVLKRSIYVNENISILLKIKNTDSVNHNVFANCTLLQPGNVISTVETFPFTLIREQEQTINIKYKADVVGTWTLSQCSVGRADTTKTVDNTYNSNIQITVSSVSGGGPGPGPDGGAGYGTRTTLFYCTTTCTDPDGCVCPNTCPTTGNIANGRNCGSAGQGPECITNSDCVGSSDSCFCSSGNCQRCASGYTCSTNRNCELVGQGDNVRTQLTTCVAVCTDPDGCVCSSTCSAPGNVDNNKSCGGVKSKEDLTGTLLFFVMVIIALGAIVLFFQYYRNKMKGQELW